jgi:hypothetical protein
LRIQAVSQQVQMFLAAIYVLLAKVIQIDLAHDFLFVLNCPRPKFLRVCGRML